MTLATIRKYKNIQHEISLLSKVVLPYCATLQQEFRYNRLSDALKMSGFERKGEKRRLLFGIFRMAKSNYRGGEFRDFHVRLLSAMERFRAMNDNDYVPF